MLCSVVGVVFSGGSYVVFSGESYVVFSGESYVVFSGGSYLVFGGGSCKFSSVVEVMLCGNYTIFHGEADILMKLIWIPQKLLTR